MSAFKIHDQLLRDCHVLGRLERSHVLLHRNALLHWFILVPETDHLDVLDLEKTIRLEVVGEAASLSFVLKKRLSYPKVNFAAIGNVVPQMHLHVIGRKPGDSVWPAPVWGHLTAASSYSAEQVSTIVDLLTTDCGLRENG